MLLVRERAGSPFRKMLGLDEELTMMAGILSAVGSYATEEDGWLDDSLVVALLFTWMALAVAVLSPIVKRATCRLQARVQ